METAMQDVPAFSFEGTPSTLAHVEAFRLDSPELIELGDGFGTSLVYALLIALSYE